MGILTYINQIRHHIKILWCHRSLILTIKNETDHENGDILLEHHTQWDIFYWGVSQMSDVPTSCIILWPLKSMRSKGNIYNYVYNDTDKCDKSVDGMGL